MNRNEAMEIANEAVLSRRAMQKPTELASLLQYLDSRFPVVNNVLEIGGMFGATLWAFSKVANGKLVCVDFEVLEGRMENAEDIEYTLFRADSTQIFTRACVLEHMGDSLFDFIFIDGDHSYDAVCKDYLLWSQLLSSNGVMAFHDICHRYMHEGEGGYHEHNMWQFWLEITTTVPHSTTAPHFEIFDPSELWGGIGVLIPNGTPSDLLYLPDHSTPGTLVPPAYCLPR